MEIGEVINCKNETELESQMFTLLTEGYAIKVEFDKMRITINEVPDDEE